MKLIDGELQIELIWSHQLDRALRPLSTIMFHSCVLKITCTSLRCPSHYLV